MLSLQTWITSHLWKDFEFVLKCLNKIKCTFCIVKGEFLFQNAMYFFQFTDGILGVQKCFYLFLDKDKVLNHSLYGFADFILFLVKLLNIAVAVLD